MGGVKLLCASTAALVAAGQIAHLSPADRIALWTSAGHVLGIDPQPAPLGTATAKLDVTARASVTAPMAQGETIDPDRYGQFHATVEVEGLRLPVMVDTGASYLCLTYEAADSLGFRPLPTDYRYLVSTANGKIAYAKVELREVRLGTITVHGVTALIAPRGALSTTLLGMSFLNKVGNFRTDGGRLVLQQ